MTNQNVPAKTPFSPLFRFELFSNTFASPMFGAIVFFYAHWVFLNSLPSVFSQTQVTFLAYSPLSPLGPVWLLVVTAICADAHIPSLMSRVQVFRPLEFLFTRALDRRVLFRAKSAAIAAILLSPLLFSVFFAMKFPQLTVAPRSGEDAVTFLQRFQEAFPSSSLQDGNVLLPQGNITLAVWHLWCGFFVVAMAHGLISLIAPWAARCRRPNLAVVVILLGLVSAGLFWFLIVGTGKYYYETLFLSFSTHWWLWIVALIACAVFIQIVCERRFSKLEIM